MKRLLLPLLAALLFVAGCGGGHHTPRHESSAQIRAEIHKTGLTHVEANGQVAPAPFAIHGGRPRAPDFGKPPKGDFGLSVYPRLGLGAALTHRGYDAVDVFNIPLGAYATPCYISGSWPNCPAMARHEPGAIRQTIATNAGATAKWLDVEPGDATASEAGNWVHSMIYGHHIYRPGVYANASTMGSVRYWLGRAGLSRGQYLLWIADWDGNPTIPAGFDAKQFKGGQVLDTDSFAPQVFGPPPVPNAPGCDAPSSAKSRCIGRFVDRRFYNPRRGDWCSKGCNERGTVVAFYHDRANPRRYAAALRRDEARLAYLDQRDLHLIHTRSVKVNGDNRLYGREHETWHLKQGINCSSWDVCSH